MHLHHSEKLQRKMSFSSTLFRKTKSSIKLLRDKKSECWNANSTLWSECQLYTVIWMPTLRCDLNANSTLWSECQLYVVIWMPTLRCDLNANSTLWSECQLYAVIWMPTLHCDLNANSTLWSECQLYTVIWMPTLRCDLNANSVWYVYTTDCPAYMLYVNSAECDLDLLMYTHSPWHMPLVFLPTEWTQTGFW